MLDKLPTDIQSHIYTFMRLDTENKGLVCQKVIWYDQECLPFKNWIIDDRNKVVKIQRFYKRNLPRLPTEKYYTLNFHTKYNKKLLVRYYIASYPMKYLLIYPEMIINTINNRGDSSKAEFLMNWIVNNIPSNINKRTRNHVKKFLMLDKISKFNIIDTGW